MRRASSAPVLPSWSRHPAVTRSRGSGSTSNADSLDSSSADDSPSHVTSARVAGSLPPLNDELAAIEQHARTLPDDPQREHNAPRYKAEALAELVDQVQDAREMDLIMERVTPAMLRNCPRLLLEITRKFVAVTQHDPDHLSRIAARCLDAAIGTDKAAEVWTSLSLQLQWALPLPAARGLLACLQARQAHLPDDATSWYIDARTHMNWRELAIEKQLI